MIGSPKAGGMVMPVSYIHHNKDGNSIKSWASTAEPPPVSYIHHNKDGNRMPVRRTHSAEIAGELHPPQQGLKLDRAAPDVLELGRPVSYIHHNKDGNLPIPTEFGPDCQVPVSYIHHNKDGNNMS